MLYINAIIDQVCVVFIADFFAANCLPFVLANDELQFRRIRCHATVLCCSCASAADSNNTDTLRLMTTQLTPNKCNDGHYSCYPPKECCKQGCCFLVGPSYARPPSVQTGNMYFWLAVTATIAGILCACSLWRKHSQGGLCCRTGSSQNRSCSEPDSIGSCYAPPQYSSCNNFHAAPPPYSEVTSKPDMYPLVISYNAEPVIKNNNTSTGYIIQYFRSFIRPIGSLSATSTNDSISSSYLCNAVNEANNIVPPTYSNVASLEELVVDSPPHPSPSGSERRLPRSASSVSSAPTEYHQVSVG
ncbi:hypothetical protein D910_07441 [Dendroctonus ponderosae]|uniref:WW domain binding protein VOPP1 n=1 Tax=Dendroctonus ponderosae TaxID=77166 RepID=U4UAJ7_DENPD|nr:hypothetical protein D910_01312 [Dendroctonus ponderosae]ERL90087.1 hypothetical protein D910_07441 [Dendroctonus ponderosae]